MSSHGQTDVTRTALQSGWPDIFTDKFFADADAEHRNTERLWPGVTEKMDRAIMAGNYPRPPRNSQPPATQPATPVDPDAAYKAEYKANPHYAKLALTEADYVASRRIDDGVDALATQGASTPPESPAPAAKPATANWLGSALPAEDPTGAQLNAANPLLGDGRHPYGIGSDIC